VQVLEHIRRIKPESVIPTAEGERIANPRLSIDITDGIAIKGRKPICLSQRRNILLPNAITAREFRRFPQQKANKKDKKKPYY